MWAFHHCYSKEEFLAFGFGKIARKLPEPNGSLQVKIRAILKMIH